LNKIPNDCRAKLGKTKTERSGGQKGRVKDNCLSLTGVLGVALRSR